MLVHRKSGRVEEHHGVTGVVERGEPRDGHNPPVDPGPGFAQRKGVSGEHQMRPGGSSRGRALMP